MPAPGFDTFIVDDPDALDTEGVVVHRANGRTTVLANPAEAGEILTSSASGDPQWAPPVGVPVFVQAAQPTNAPVPSLWIPLDDSGNPVSADQWQVFA